MILLYLQVFRRGRGPYESPGRGREIHLPRPRVGPHFSLKTPHRPGPLNKQLCPSGHQASQPSRGRSAHKLPVPPNFDYSRTRLYRTRFPNLGKPANTWMGCTATWSADPAP